MGAECLQKHCQDWVPRLDFTTKQEAWLAPKRYFFCLHQEGEESGSYPWDWYFWKAPSAQPLGIMILVTKHHRLSSP